MALRGSAVRIRLAPLLKHSYSKPVLRQQALVVQNGHFMLVVLKGQLMLVNCRTTEREKKGRKSIEEMIARWIEANLS